MSSAAAFLVGLIIGWILSALITLGILWLVSYLAQNHEQDEHINQLNINENGN